MLSIDESQLTEETLDFLRHGAPVGSRNTRLYKAARELYQQGVSKEELPRLLRGTVPALPHEEFARVINAVCSEPTGS